uniref:Uncharacterized protein n=1 Tax=Octopus bimaculoides TaxID=37653 RepID=A0A0L8G0M2_OCTBM
MPCPFGMSLQDTVSVSRRPVQDAGETGKPSLTLLFSVRRYLKCGLMLNTCCPAKEEYSCRLSQL